MKNIDTRISAFLTRKLSGKKFKAEKPESIKFWGKIDNLTFKNRVLYIKGTLYIRVYHDHGDDLSQRTPVEMNLQQYYSLYYNDDVDDLKEQIEKHIFKTYILPISRFVAIEDFEQTKFEFKLL